MADEDIDKEIEAAFNSHVEKAFKEHKHKNGEKTKKKLTEEMGPDIKKLTEPSDSDVLESVGAGLKKGVADLGGGTENAAGLGAQFGGQSADVEEPTMGQSLKNTAGNMLSLMPDIKLPTNVVTQPAALLDMLRNSQGPTKNWENYIRASQPFNLSQALRKEVAPDYEQAALEQALADQEAMTAGGGLSVAAELAPQMALASAGGVGMARSKMQAPNAPFTPAPKAAISPLERAKAAGSAFFSGGGGSKMSMMDRAGKALDASRGIIDPGEGTANSYGRFGISQVPEELQMVRPQDIEMESPRIPEGPQFSFEDPDTVFANRPEDQLQSLMNTPRPPGVPPDYLEGQSVEPVFQPMQERTEITAPPEQSSVFQYNGVSPSDNTQVGSAPNPAQGDVMAMAQQLEAELAARRANAPTQKGRLNDVNLNLPHDTIASRNMPRTDLTVEQPSPFNDEFGTVNLKKPVEMRPEMVGGDIGMPRDFNMEFEAMQRARIPEPPKRMMGPYEAQHIDYLPNEAKRYVYDPYRNAVNDEAFGGFDLPEGAADELMSNGQVQFGDLESELAKNGVSRGSEGVPQFVRDAQSSPSGPYGTGEDTRTFGDQGRPDDEQNQLWLEQQIRANKFDKAEKMLRARFGDKYVDYLINNIDLEDLDLHK